MTPATLTFAVLLFCLGGIAFTVGALIGDWRARRNCRKRTARIRALRREMDAMVPQKWSYR